MRRRYHPWRAAFLRRVSSHKQNRTGNEASWMLCFFQIQYKSESLKELPILSNLKEKEEENHTSWENLKEKEEANSLCTLPPWLLKICKRPPYGFGSNCTSNSVNKKLKWPYYPFQLHIFSLPCLFPVYIKHKLTCKLNPYYIIY